LPVVSIFIQLRIITLTCAALLLPVACGLLPVALPSREKARPAVVILILRLTLITQEQGS